MLVSFSHEQYVSDQPFHFTTLCVVLYGYGGGMNLKFQNVTNSASTGPDLYPKLLN